MEHIFQFQLNLNTQLWYGVYKKNLKISQIDDRDKMLRQYNIYNSAVNPGATLYLNLKCINFMNVIFFLALLFHTKRDAKRVP